mgnify:CR=1 FL=1
MENSIFYFINGFLLLISFFLTRVVLITYSVYVILIPYMIENLDILNILMYIGYFSLYFLNIFWFNKILVKFFKVIKGNKVKK